VSARAIALVAAAGLGGVAACDDPLTGALVTVEARPAVGEVESLEVTFANDNATLSQTFQVGGRSFPLSFSVETPGRSGDVVMTARGLAEDGTLVALGEASATITADQLVDATLMLDPADFGVNTSVAGSQRLAWSTALAGVQIAAGADGTFTIGFSDDCGALGRCDVWGRRFDVRAVPLETEIQASTDQFNINLTDVFGNDPALAINGDGQLLTAWSTFNEILAVAITPPGGTVSFSETLVSDGTSPDDAVVAALPDGRFVVVWVETLAASTERAVRARFLDENGAPSVNPETGTSAAFTVDTATGDEPDTPAVAVSGDGLQMGFVWRDGTAIRARFTGTDGRFQTASELAIASYDPFDDVWTPRVEATGGGRFLLAWGHRTFGGGPVDDGAIVVRQIITPTATPVGTDSLVARGTADSFSRFGLARGGDGAFLVTWHACGAIGDGDNCGVLARAFRDTGLPVGEPFVVNTTTAGDQVAPSIAWLGAEGADSAYAVTWTDGSGAEPDTSDEGIRARVIYPAFATARGVLGAPCDGGDGCGAGLVCLEGTDAVTRCHAECDPAGPDPDCPDGGVCTTAGDVSGCKL
jgi:hypothetical protein